MSAAALERPRTTRRVVHVMGMPVSLALRGRHTDDAAARDAWAEVVAALRDVDRVFSTYRPDSWVSRLARGEVALRDCPTEVAEVLAIGEAARRASAGAFDVRRHGLLDPSGVVKGWATDRAALALRRLEDTDFCLSAGGDMVCHTASEGPSARPWTVGVEHPLRPDRLVARVPVWRGAVATSGRAHRGDHVVDARTGDAATTLASVTVVGDDLVAVDVEATSALALGEDAPAWLAAIPGRTGLLVWADGRVETVGGR